MAEFYVENSEQNSGEHLIHFSTCDALQSVDSARYLGSIASFQSAAEEAKRVFFKIGACPQCASRYVSG